VTIVYRAEPITIRQPSFDTARTNQKPKNLMLITRTQWPSPLTKFRSRKSEAASPIGAAPNATLRS
jgi:hypothetical protein